MKLFSKKKEVTEFLSTKEINKKVKELVPLKENEPDNEYNLAIILKSLVNILYNYSRQINLGNDSKQELDIPAIDNYFDRFKTKSYYNIKILPITYFIKSHYLLSKKERGFLNSIKDINYNINKEKKLNDNQIDRINYIIINNFQKFINSKEKSEIFSFLFYIFKNFNEKGCSYLFDYYTTILLISLYFFDIESNTDSKTIIINILTILFIIISEEENNYLSELAFILFCEYYPKVDNNPFTFTDQSKWLLLILKLFKNEVKLFNSESENENNIYNFIKPFHHKFFIGEIERNKIRSSFIKQTFLNVTTINIFQYIKCPENNEEAQIYLNNGTYEKFPKELHLPKGPSNSFYKYLFNNYKNINIKLEEKKRNIIFGALQISSFMLKNKYKENDFDFRYFSMKLSNELVKSIMPLYKKDKHIMRICLYCLGSMMSICPEHIIRYFPSVFETFKSIGNKDKYFLNLSYSLDYFFKKSSEILLKAYKESDIKIIEEINKINLSLEFYQNIYSLMVIIFNIPNLKIIKKTDKNSEVNLSSLVNNSFNFFSILINEYFLENHNLPFDVEANLIYLIIKFPTIYFKKYMTKIVCKIYNTHILIGIYKNLFIDEFNHLRYKTLFFIIRLLISEKMINYLDFFSTFLKKNIIFEISSPSEIIDYLVLHITFNQNKFYLSNFQNEEEDYKINNEDLEIFSLERPKTNIKILNYIIDIFFQCIKESEKLDDINNINKLIKLILINLIHIDEKNMELLLEFLMKYLNNINKSISAHGYQKNQHNLRKFFELLYYTNFYININEYSSNYIKAINPHYLVRFYHLVMMGIIQLFPNNFSSKEFDFLNIIPLIYLYLFTIPNLYEQNNDIKEQLKVIISELASLIIELPKNNYNNNAKYKNQINPSHLAFFYIYYFIRNIDSKKYFSFISFYLSRFLNIEEFKLDINNVEVNALNFMLFNLFIKILYLQESSKENISKKLSDALNSIKTKLPLIDKIYRIIKEFIGDINKNDEIIEFKKDELNQKIIKEYDEKSNFIIKNIKFKTKTNFIQTVYDKKDNINNNINEVITKDDLNKKNEKKEEDNFKEKNNIIVENYQLWLNFLNKTKTLNKSKKGNSEEDIKMNDDLLKDVFSFYSKKLDKNIGLIKSEEIRDKDISLFSPLLSYLGDIISKGNKFLIQKETNYEKFIIDLDKIYSSDIIIVLIKDNFLQYEDSILNQKFVIYIKPSFLKSVYSIKITKNSEYKFKTNNVSRICNQIDNDINKIFSDFMIIDFNNKIQVDYFYQILNILFGYSLLENIINNYMNSANK